MVKALKVVLIVYGAILLVMGLGAVFVPDQMAELFGFGGITNDIVVLSAITGILGISAGIWLIVAGRDPLGNIYWVKFAITKAVLSVIVAAYLIIQGYADFSQLGGVIILDGIFTVLFLVFYPWRPAQIGD